MELRHPFILASASPRRRELLIEAGFDPRIVPAEGVHERIDSNLSPAELTRVNARAKATRVAAEHPGAIVLGADTLVFIDGVPLGKPRDSEEAAAMLRRLAARTHEVCTAVCLRCHDDHQLVEFHESTRVTFKKLSNDDITGYLAKVDPLDKAGAYAAQESGHLIIDQIDGSWTNVVGLPIEKTVAALERWRKETTPCVE
jgi:septum formation protein